MMKLKNKETLRNTKCSLKQCLTLIAHHKDKRNISLIAKYMYAFINLKIASEWWIFWKSCQGAILWAFMLWCSFFPQSIARSCILYRWQHVIDINWINRQKSPCAETVKFNICMKMHMKFLIKHYATGFFTTIFVKG